MVTRKPRCFFFFLLNRWFFSCSLRWLFEKYDGIRGFWNPLQKTFFSRHGKRLRMPQRIIDAMPNIFLDGELWYHHFLCLNYSYSQTCSFFFVSGLEGVGFKRLWRYPMRLIPLLLTGHNWSIWYSTSQLIRVTIVHAINNLVSAAPLGDAECLVSFFLKLSIIARKKMYWVDRRRTRLLNWLPMWSAWTPATWRFSFKILWMTEERESSWGTPRHLMNRDALVASWSTRYRYLRLFMKGISCINT